MLGVVGMVAMATSVESLYAGVKGLVYIVKSNSDIHHEMERLHGYQTLAYLLKRHKDLVNNHILQLIVTLAGTSDATRDQLTMPTNSLAFRDLLADLDVISTTKYSTHTQTHTQTGDKSANNRFDSFCQSLRDVYYIRGIDFENYRKSKRLPSQNVQKALGNNNPEGFRNPPSQIYLPVIYMSQQRNG